MRAWIPALVASAATALFFGCGGGGGSSTGSGGSQGVLCVPGEQKACACPYGVQGAQACLPDGSGFDACQGCGGGSGSSSSGSTSSSSGSTSSSSGSTSSSSGSTSSSSSSTGSSSSSSGTSSSSSSSSSTSTSTSSSSSGTSSSSSSSSSGSPICYIPGTCTYAASIATTPFSGQGLTGTICPGGPDMNATPMLCMLEVDLGSAALSLTGGPPTYTVTGTIPLRLADLPISATFLSVPYDADVVIDSGGTCPGTAQAFVPISVQATMTLTGNGPPVVGCSQLAVSTLTLDQAQIQSAMGVCGSGLPGQVVTLAKQVVTPAVTALLETIVNQAVTGQVCYQ